MHPNSYFEASFYTWCKVFQKKKMVLQENKSLLDLNRSYTATLFLLFILLLLSGNENNNEVVTTNYESPQLSDRRMPSKRNVGRYIKMGKTRSVTHDKTKKKEPREQRTENHHQLFPCKNDSALKTKRNENNTSPTCTENSQPRWKASMAPRRRQAEWHPTSGSNTATSRRSTKLYVWSLSSTLTAKPRYLGHQTKSYGWYAIRGEEGKR